MLNYSIHTYQLFVPLSYDEYYNLRNKLSSMKASIEPPKMPYNSSYGKSTIVTKSHFYRKLKMPGISEIELSSTEVLEPGCADSIYQLKAGAYIRINPYNAIHALHNSTHDIVDARDIKRAATHVSNMLLSLLGEELHKKIKLCRCDFCVNLPFDSAEKATLYVRLLQKCIPKPSLTEPTCIDPISHHTVPKYPDSLLLECGSYSFQVYNKQEQMKNNKIGDSDSAIGLVRIELRAEKAKLDTLYKHHGGSSKNYIDFLSKASSICYLEVTSLLSAMVGEGDFVSYNNIKKQISKKIKNDFTQSELKDFVKMIHKRKRCSSMLEEHNMTYSDWKQLLKKFNKINRSPITIPSREDVDYLPGILSWDEYFS